MYQNLKENSDAKGLILFFYLRLGLPSGLFLTFFPTKSLYAFLFFPLRSPE
jgi:hypothetical protein